MFGQQAPGSASPAVTPLERLASLLRRRNAIDAGIASLIGRPALPGHIGEFIAAEVFDIQLERSATTAGYHGVFRSGPLAGATVNAKLHGKRDGLLDIPQAAPHHFLVLTGPRAAAMSSLGDRPLLIEEAFLFDGPELVSPLQQRGVRIGVATSVRTHECEHARVWPATAGQPSSLTEDQQAALSLFSANGDLAGRRQPAVSFPRLLSRGPSPGSTMAVSPIHLVTLRSSPIILLGGVTWWEGCRVEGLARADRGCTPPGHGSRNVAVSRPGARPLGLGRTGRPTRRGAPGIHRRNDTVALATRRASGAGSRLCQRSRSIANLRR
jgi:hypothetical protein